MAVHANFGRRNSGKRRRFHGRVAVAAIDSIIGYVMLVAKGYGLNARYSHFSDVRGFIDGRQCGNDSDSQCNASEDSDPRNRVRAAMKYLRHRLALKTSAAGVWASPC